MSKVLVIGSTVCDVKIELDQLPGRQGDAHIKRQQFQLGGCAFNVAYVLDQLGMDYTLFSPVGSGIYGQFVSKELAALGMTTPLQVEEANGCCYCFVEEDGERTFLSDHGAEYLFHPQAYHALDLDAYSYAYVCGLEVEEKTGDQLVEALATFPGQLVFCPGPRGELIPAQRLKDLLALSPILHLNEQEAKTLTGKVELALAVETLHKWTKNLVLVTLGKEGVIAYDGTWYQEKAVKTEVIDTIGAGDSHVSAFLAASLSGLALPKALAFANRVSAAIVSSPGVFMSPAVTSQLQDHLSGQ